MNFAELFENAVLNDETKQVIQEAFATAIAAKEKELQEAHDVQIVEEKAKLADDMINLVEEAINEELESLKDEIVHARTLEVQYAEKLQDFKESYAEAQEERVRALIAESLVEELDELKEDVEMAKKNKFAMKMFESFKETYEMSFGAEPTAIEELAQLKEEVDTLRRDKKMTELLEGLEGRKRSIAETILGSVETEKLEERFTAIHGVLLAEHVDTTVTESGTKEEEEGGILILENQEEKKVEPDKQELSLSQKKLNESLKGIRFN